MMKIVLMVLGTVVVFGLSAVWGLVWAIQHNQFRMDRSGPASIFDEAEPIGQATDSFPDQKPLSPIPQKVE